MDSILTYIIIGVVVIVIVGGIIFTIVRTNAIKKNGIEANAVVSRIKEQENTDSEGFTDRTVRVLKLNLAIRQAKLKSVIR